MLSGKNLTIRDYFDQLSVPGRKNRSGSPSDRLKSAGKTNFNQILSSKRTKPVLNLNTKTTGLTIADYMAHSMQTNRPHRYPPISTSSELKENKTDTSAGRMEVPSPKNTSGETISASQPQSQHQQTLKKIESLPTSEQNGLGKHPKIDNSIRKAAQKYDLPPELIKGVIRAESNFEVKAVSRAGAQGLMQLMPATAKELGVTNPFDIDQNIDGGSRYLRQMLDSFGGDVKLALAGYNAGPGTVKNYGGDVPFRETKLYVNRVIRFSQQEV